MTAMTRDVGDPGDLLRFFSDGKKDLLDALHRPGPRHGRGSASVVGPGAHLTVGGVLLVGSVQERMV